MKIVILFAKAGGGHESCAKAIKSQIEKDNFTINSPKDSLVDEKIPENWQENQAKSANFNHYSKKPQINLEPKIENSYQKPKIEVELVDILGKAPNWQQKLFCQSYVFLTEKTPKLWSFLQILWKWDFLARLTSLPLKVQIWGYLQEIVKQKPDKIICTYFLVNEWLEEIQKNSDSVNKISNNVQSQKTKIQNLQQNLVDSARLIFSQGKEDILESQKDFKKNPNLNLFSQKSLPKIPVWTIITDIFSPHSVWFVAKNCKYIVFSQNAKKIAQSRQIPKNNIVELTPFFNPKFEENPSKKTIENWKKHFLTTDLLQIPKINKDSVKLKNLKVLTNSESLENNWENQQIPTVIENRSILKPINQKFQSQTKPKIEIKNFQIVKNSKPIFQNKKEQKLQSFEQNNNKSNKISFKISKIVSSSQKITVEIPKKIFQNKQNKLSFLNVGLIQKYYKNNESKESLVKKNKIPKQNLIQSVACQQKKLENTENTFLGNFKNLNKTLTFDPQNWTKSRENIFDWSTLLVVGGGESMPKGERILEEILKIDLNFNLIFVCGRNLKLQKNCEDIVKKWQVKPKKVNLLKKWQTNIFEDYKIEENQKKNSKNTQKNIQIHGFSFNLFEFINMADIVICKAGPATILECVSQKKLVIISHFIWEQEIGNRDFILENGLGFFEPKPTKLAQKIEYLLKNQTKIAQIKENYQKIKLQNGLQNLTDFIINS